MIRIKRVNMDECNKYKDRIAELLFLNDKAHNYTESITFEESVQEAKNMCSYIYEDKADVICAFDDNNIVGLIWAFPFQFRDELRMHIKAMIVDPQYRGKGLSQLLLSEIEKAAVKRTIYVVDTYVDWSNIKARGAYEKRGLLPDRVLVRKTLSK